MSAVSRSYSAGARWAGGGAGLCQDNPAPPLEKTLVTTAHCTKVGSAWWYPGPERARSAPRVARARARSARLTV